MIWYKIIAISIWFDSKIFSFLYDLYNFLRYLNVINFLNSLKNTNYHHFYPKWFLTPSITFIYLLFLYFNRLKELCPSATNFDWTPLLEKLNYQKFPCSSWLLSFYRLVLFSMHFRCYCYKYNKLIRRKNTNMNTILKTFNCIRHSDGIDSMRNLFE